MLKQGNINSSLIRSNTTVSLSRFIMDAPPPHALWSFIQVLLRGSNAADVEFWWRTTGQIFTRLLEKSSCSPRLQRDFITFYIETIIPLLGPRPRAFADMGIEPKSWLSDDHTSVEFIYVIDGDECKPSIRFAMEPLSPHDGTSLPPQSWRRTIDDMSKLSIMKGCDNSWPDVCYNNLIHVPENETETQHSTQFFLGCDFTPAGMVGKYYYIPKLRAQIDQSSGEDVVTRCIRELGSMDESWKMVISYLDSLPDALRPSMEMVAVDTLAPSRNRIKIYYRSHENTLDAIVRHLTLDGKLDDESTRQTVSVFRNLSGFLFPGVATDEPLLSKRNWPGFLMYYELTPRTTVPFPKVYIPVRQYCQNDAQIADAVGKYLRSTGNAAGDRYAADFKRLMKHRSIESRTGIHTYIACCGRKTGPQLSMYLSPEVFAPERK